MRKVICASGLLAMGVSCSVNADSLLRVKCFDDNQDAEVFINNKFVGNCPLDAPVPDGIVQVRARKKLENDYERLFEKQLTVVDGIAQKVEVILSAPQLTKEGLRKKDEAELNAQNMAAKSGDINAMMQLAERYKNGTGVEKDFQKAQYWLNQIEKAKAQAELNAARQGNINAMLTMADRYETGRGVEKDPSQAKSWREKAEAAKQEKIAGEKQAVKQEKLAQVDFMGFVHAYGSSNMAHEINDNPISILLSGLPSLLVASMLDTIAAPTRSTEIKQIEHEAALRPSTWGKPDSMIAKAATQRKSDQSGEKLMVASK